MFDSGDGSHGVVSRKPDMEPLYNQPVDNDTSDNGIFCEVTETGAIISCLGDYNHNTTLPGKDLHHAVRIFLYSLIFLLGVLGNSLVIVVLIRNQRMRTVTNIFLLSLAVSDLMLCLFCIPFTLIPNLLEDFIFGSTICSAANYFMGQISVPVQDQTVWMMQGRVIHKNQEDGRRRTKKSDTPRIGPPCNFENPAPLVTPFNKQKS
ncbi:unnamed protein product [Ranitomeya imitator]|uniref:G-protein coupled receptors family 1 profile domain-containing protein n=1 Tax=Ranitomeya imitator TaxID=111125 RepID=A0ABN9LNT1_9NEOB|nr:unnamed protein product [Ranitomeya imitator]